MPEDFDELEPEHRSLPPDVQALLRQGRKAARDVEAQTLEIARLDKKRAIVEAGVPDHPAREAVFANYDGPLEPDAIKAYAEKMGIAAAPASQDAGPTPEELAAASRILTAGGGAPPPASDDTDLGVAIRNTHSKEELHAILEQVSGDPGFRNREGLIGELDTGIV